MQVRLRNTRSGVIAVVDEDTASQLGPEWAPADSPPSSPDPAPAPRKTRTPKASD